MRNDAGAPPLEGFTEAFAADAWVTGWFCNTARPGQIPGLCTA